MGLATTLLATFSPLYETPKCKNLSEDGICINKESHHRNDKVTNSKRYCSYKGVCKHYETIQKDLGR